MTRRRNISKQTRLILKTLAADPAKWWYGYELCKQTLLKSGTLYPILMRLSDQKFLISEWRDPERPGKPPRHVYRLTTTGLALASSITEEPTIASTISSTMGTA